MPYTIPFAPQNRLAGSIADLMGRRGDIEAQGAINAGNATAQAVSGIGQALSGALQQYAQYKQQEPQRKIQAMQLQQAERGVQGQRALAGMLQGDQLAPDATGPRQESYVGSDGTFDIPKLTSALSSGGYGDLAPSLLQGAQTINTSLQAHRDAQTKFAQMQAVLLGDLAAGVLRLTEAGTPMDRAIDFAVQGAVQSKALDGQQVAAVKAQLVAMSPEQQKAALGQLMDAGARLAGGGETLADGATRYDRYGRQTATNEKPMTFGQPQAVTVQDGSTHLISQGSNGQFYENGKVYAGPPVTGLAARPTTTPKTLDQLQAEAYAKGDMAEVARLRGQLAMNAGASRAPNTDTLVLRNPTTGQQQLVPKTGANTLLSQGWVVNDPVQMRADVTDARLNDTNLRRADAALATIGQLVTFDEPDVAGNRPVSKQHPGLSGVFGTVQGRMPTFSQTTADAEVLVNQVVSMATLPEMQSLRGLGPASDRDVAIVQNGATTLQNRQMSDAAALRELAKIYDAMLRLKKDAEQARRAVPGLTGAPGTGNPGTGAPGTGNPFRTP